MAESVRDSTVKQLVDALVRRYPRVPESRVSAVVGEEYDQLAGNPILIYLPNLVEHEARERLRMAG